MFLHLYFYFLQPFRSFLFNVLVYSGVIVLLVLLLYPGFPLLITSENAYPPLVFLKGGPRKRGFWEAPLFRGIAVQGINFFLFWVET